jgi:hypothetical protein
MVQPDNLPVVAEGSVAAGHDLDSPFDLALPAAVAITSACSGFSRTIAFATSIFVSILMRELLGSVVSVVCGRRATVVSMTLSSNTKVGAQSLRGRLVALQLAGPVISLLFAAALHCAFPTHAPTWFAGAVEFNAAWGVVSLLPALPFAGGRILQACLGPERDVATMLVSVGVAEAGSAMAIVGLRSPGLCVLFLMGGLSAALQWLRSRRRVLDSRALEQLQQARALLEAKQYGDACRSAEDVVYTACKPDIRNAALTLLARASIHAGEPGKASAAIRSITPRAAVDAGTLAAVENANGDPGRAIATLDGVRRKGGLDQAGARLLIDLHASVGDYRRVTDVAIELSRLLGAEDMQVVANALSAARESELAARLESAFVPASALGREGTSSRGRHPLAGRKRRAPSSS